MTNNSVSEDIIIDENTLSKGSVKNIAELSGVLEEPRNTSELFRLLLSSALSLDASDIHLEPEQDDIKIRFRIDGVLHDVSYLKDETYKSLLSRIKLKSGIKLNIRDRPQDGRFTFVANKGSEIEVRSSSLPSEYGESVVMRILNPESLVDMEGLGLRKDLYEMFQREISKPNGMVITTGPTGSGKTTTLYAFLRQIRSPETKSITIEDPIEYHLEGISQTQVNPDKKYDFASGLRAIVRQDPDVILVGEIRDTETAKISLQAALTGHLVFSTLHTNDAAGTVSRLVSLGADLANIGPALNLVIAQRLVRKVCQVCSNERMPTFEELDRISAGLEGLPRDLMPEQVTIKASQTCKECNHTGYKGRTGIYEALVIDDILEEFISTNPSIASVRAKAKENGMVSMRQDGLLKVAEGTTTMEEVERVTKE